MGWLGREETRSLSTRDKSRKGPFHFCQQPGTFSWGLWGITEGFVCGVAWLLWIQATCIQVIVLPLLSHPGQERWLWQGMNLPVSQLSRCRVGHHIGLWALVHPGGFSYHQALSEAESGSPCLLPVHHFSKEGLCGQRAGYKLGKLAQLVPSTNLSVWFGSLSWPPSQRPFPDLRDELSPRTPPLDPKTQGTIRLPSEQMSSGPKYLLTGRQPLSDYDCLWLVFPWSHIHWPQLTGNENHRELLRKRKKTRKWFSSS